MSDKIKYRSFELWRKNEPKAYQAALKMGLLPKICAKFKWDHKYPNAKNYTYTRMGIIYRHLKFIKETGLINNISVIKQKKEFYYLIETSIPITDFKKYEEINSDTRQILICDKKRIGVGFFLEPVVRRNKKLVRLSNAVFTLPVKCFRKTKKEINDGYLDTFNKHCILYEKMVDYILDEKFAHLKNF